MAAGRKRRSVRPFQRENAEISPLATLTLVDRYRQGDELAATLLFERYFFRLSALARSRLSARLATRVDSDDVVQSAYRSFFVKARAGTLSISRPGELWPLLVEMTLHKLYRQAARHGAAKRSMRREVSLNGLSDLPHELISREPDPVEAAVVVDEVETVLAELPATARRIVELRLQGEEQASIARQLCISERTVRRWIERARVIIERRTALLTSSRKTLARKHEQAGRGAKSNPAKPRTKSAVRKKAKPRAPFALPRSLPHVGFDELVLEQMIGAGASGKVYRARYKDHRQQVAAKFLRKSFLSDLIFVRRFLAEAELVFRLHHPHILRTVGVGQSRGGGLFLVTELARTDLQREIVRGGISTRCAVEWTLQAASAVQHAHEHGVIHCDLKPANLLLTDDNRVLLSDFGLAQRIDDHSGHLLHGGTPAFMAPEQISDSWGQLSPQTDVFGLGAVLFSLLTGRPPFLGSRTADLVAQIISGQPCQWPRNPKLKVPRRIVDIVCLALQKKPGDRFSSMANFASQLADSLPR